MTQTNAGRPWTVNNATADGWDEGLQSGWELKHRHPIDNLFPFTGCPE